MSEHLRTLTVCVVLLGWDPNPDNLQNGTTRPRGRGIFAIATHYQLIQNTWVNPKSFLMGQVIHLALPPAYPATTDGLGVAECILLAAVRWWVADHRKGKDPLPRLCGTMRACKIEDAAFSVDRFMAVIARSICRPIAIHGPRCRHLSGDERHLLHAASLTQTGQSGQAKCALRTALLSARGAEFALGPLEGLSELFTMARLFFCKRRAPPVDQPDAAETSEPLMAATPPRQIH